LIIARLPAASAPTSGASAQLPPTLLDRKSVV
jgi:hypothetical protein